MINDDGLDAIGEIANWVSPRLSIKFDMSGEELQIYRPDGSKFFSYAEVNEQLEQEKQRAEQAQQELEAERQRWHRVPAQGVIALAICLSDLTIL